jgi:hypothetical protein
MEPTGVEGIRGSYMELNPEKLVELIVRECMTTILKESKWYWDKDEFESSNAIQNAAMKVKEHFGVK